MPRDEFRIDWLCRDRQQTLVGTTGFELRSNNGLASRHRQPRNSVEIASQTSILTKRMVMSACFGGCQWDSGLMDPEEAIVGFITIRKFANSVQPLQVIPQ